MNPNTRVVATECKPCGGTGIYHGFAEPAGVGVVCIKCSGTGRVDIEYTPFTGRKQAKHTHTVRLSKGSLVATGIGPTGSEVTYEEFLAGRLPT